MKPRTFESVKDMPALEREVVEAVMESDAAWDAFATVAATGGASDAEYRAALEAKARYRRAIDALKNARALVATGH